MDEQENNGLKNQESEPEEKQPNSELSATSEAEDGLKNEEERKVLSEITEEAVDEIVKNAKYDLAKPEDAKKLLRDVLILKDSTVSQYTKLNEVMIKLKDSRHLMKPLILKKFLAIITQSPIQNHH